MDLVISTHLRMWSDDRKRNHIEILQDDHEYQSVDRPEDYINPDHEAVIPDEATLITVRCWGGFALAKEIHNQCEERDIMSRIWGDECATRPYTPIAYDALFADAVEDCLEEK